MKYLVLLLLLTSCTYHFNGKVVDDSGNPISNVNISFGLSPWHNLEGEMTTFSGVTGSNGEFSILYDIKGDPYIELFVEGYDFCHGQYKKNTYAQINLVPNNGTPGERLCTSTILVNECIKSLVVDGEVSFIDECPEN